MNSQMQRSGLWRVLHSTGGCPPSDSAWAVVLRSSVKMTMPTCESARDGLRAHDDVAMGGISPAAQMGPADEVANAGHLAEAVALAALHDSGPPFLDAVSEEEDPLFVPGGVVPGDLRPVSLPAPAALQASEMEEWMCEVYDNATPPGQCRGQATPTAPCHAARATAASGRRARVLHAAGQMGLGPFDPFNAEEEMRRAGVGDAEQDAAPAAQRAARRPQPSTAPELLSSEGESGGEGADHSVASLVIAMASAIHEAADRVGHVASGGDAPLWLQNFQCARLLGALLWDAAGPDAADKPALKWFLSVAANIEVPLVFNEFSLAAADAVKEGFAALRDAMRSWGVMDEEGLADRLRSRRRRARVGKALGAAAVRETVLDAVQFDARVALLDEVVRQLVLAFGRRAAPAPPQEVARMHRQQGRKNKPGEPPCESWAHLHQEDLRCSFARRIPTLRACPNFLRGRWRHALRFALEARREARLGGREDEELLAWRLFGLLPVMLLHRPRDQQGVPRATLERRFDDFNAGRWAELLADARTSEVGDGSRKPGCKTHQMELHAELCEVHRLGPTPRGRAAQASVKLGEVSRGRQNLTGASLAPGTLATFNALQDKRPAEAQRPLPADVLSFQPDIPLQLDRELFLTCLKTAPRGSAPGPGGCTFEHLRVLLDDEGGLEDLMLAAEVMAQAAVPAEVAEAYTAARLTALSKPTGGVRGIAAGTTLRRLVARTLARQFGGEVEAACSPYQFALSTRAGTDCVGHVVRAVTDSRPTATLLSIDGVGAFDYVSRAAMLGKLKELPGASSMLPFLRMSYAQPSRYAWLDDEGKQHFVVQGEGGEQGDPLMPLLFFLGIHAALLRV